MFCSGSTAMFGFFAAVGVGWPVLCPPGSPAHHDYDYCKRHHSHEQPFLVAVRLVKRPGRNARSSGASNLAQPVAQTAPQ